MIHDTGTTDTNTNQQKRKQQCSLRQPCHCHDTSSSIEGAVQIKLHP